MPAPRFHCPGPLVPGEPYLLPDAIAHHAGRVLRLREGDAIVLFDGMGGESPGTLRFDGKKAWAQLGGHDPREAELPGRITLVQGLPSGDKMDWVVEKAVELGVARISPIAARRSVVQLSGERRAKRMIHWHRIASAACEQCGRNRLPALDEPASLADWLAKRDAASPAFLCHPEAEASLAQALRDADVAQAGALTLLVGPEGGWSDDEVELAARHGVHAFRFGPRVLRTETAGLAMIAAAAAVMGWVDG